jgi:hypothetical protein
MSERMLQQQVRRAAELAEAIKPLLADQPPQVVGAALGELAAMLIAGHSPDIRAEARQRFVEMVDDLVPVEVEQMIAAGRVPKDWRNADA